MAERVLRDQCEHERYERHQLPGWKGIAPPPRQKLVAEWCHGGREGTIDYEATLPHLMDLRADAQDPDREDIGYYHDGELLNVGKAIVDAALPDLEV